MNIQENVSLTNYSTMKLGGRAQFLVVVESEDELLKAIEFATKNSLKIKVLGGGSNVIFTDAGFDGLVIINEIKGFETLTENNDTIIEIAAGEVWDECVEKIVEAGLTGVEALSLIPGSAGATPVQNVGAYGQEISDSFIKLRAWDLQTKAWVELKNQDCGFEYRKSIFNSSQKNRYIITKIWLELKKSQPRAPFYQSVQEYFSLHNIINPTNLDLRNAVISIRQAKLPDPKVLPNTGSFFKNPIINVEQFSELQRRFPEIPNFAKNNNVKIPAAWLLENAGLKDYKHASGLATYNKQPLVIVNRGANSEKDLENFKSEIIEKVERQFDVKLEQEPETVYN